MRRAQAIFGALVFLAICLLALRDPAFMEELLTMVVPEAAEEAPAKTLATSDLPCADYREHRKNVDEALIIPVLQDKRVPFYPVLEVTDGDTIVVDNGERTRVRLLAMDTPERTTTRNGQIEYFGEEAYLFAKSLIEQSDWEVRLTYDQTRQDRYGRDLAYVWLKDGRMLNAVLVAEGYAYSYTASPKPQYVDLFLALMREARAENKGLWGVCE